MAKLKKKKKKETEGEKKNPPTMGALRKGRKSMASDPGPFRIPSAWLGGNIWPGSGLFTKDFSCPPYQGCVIFPSNNGHYLK